MSVVAGALIWAPAALGAASCDQRGGETLTANQHVRVYVRSVGHHLRQVRTCAYSTRKDVQLSPEGPQPSLKDLTYSVHGYLAVAIQYLLPPDGPTNRTSGVSFNTATVWDGRRGNYIGQPQMPTGLRFQTPVVSGQGLIAAIGDPAGLALSDDPDTRPNAALTNSEIVVSNAITASPWTSVATATSGVLQGLSATGTFLVWTNQGQLQSGPFAPSA